MAEADFAAVLKELGGRAFTREIAAWVHGTRELPLEELLQPHGRGGAGRAGAAAAAAGPARDAKRRASQIKTVLRGGAAEQAGFAANDEWLGVEVGRRRLAHDQAGRPAALRRQPQEGDGAGGARPPPVAAGAEPAGRGDHLAAGLARRRPGPSHGWPRTPERRRRLRGCWRCWRSCCSSHVLALQWLAAPAGAAGRAAAAGHPDVHPPAAARSACRRCPRRHRRQPAAARPEPQAARRRGYHEAGRRLARRIRRLGAAAAAAA